jgi:hypothetical protein
MTPEVLATDRAISTAVLRRMVDEAADMLLAAAEAVTESCKADVKGPTAAERVVGPQRAKRRLHALVSRLNDQRALGAACRQVGDEFSAQRITERVDGALARIRGLAAVCDAAPHATAGSPAASTQGDNA